MIEVSYIVAGDTAYVSNFSGDFSELLNYFPSEKINALELQGVKKVVWGLVGEDHELLENFPRFSES